MSYKYFTKISFRTSKSS